MCVFLNKKIHGLRQYICEISESKASYLLFVDLSTTTRILQFVMKSLKARENVSSVS